MHEIMNKTSHERWYFDPHSLRSTSTPYLPGCEVKNSSTENRREAADGAWGLALGSGIGVLRLGPMSLNKCHWTRSQRQPAPGYASVQ